MSAYDDDPLGGGPSILVILFVALIAAFVGIFLVWLLPADAAEALLHTEPLPCAGHLAYYDTNGYPEDGAEVVKVFAEREDTPRVTIYYGDGEKGEFLRALVTLPQHVPHVIADVDEFAATFPHPCDIVLAVGESA